MAGLILTGLSDLLIPLENKEMAVGLIVILLMAAQFFFGLGLMVFNTGQLSMRQAITPDDLQGRMNATMSFIVGRGRYAAGGIAWRVSG